MTPSTLPKWEGSDLVPFKHLKDQYGFLSNFYPCSMVVCGREFHTSEAVYQAMKFTDEVVQNLIRECNTPWGAKSLALGNTSKVRSDWHDSVKIAAMYVTLSLKCRVPWVQSKIASMGLSHSGKRVVEVSSRPNDPWSAVRESDGVWVGHNHLGVIWSRVLNHPEYPTIPISSISQKYGLSLFGLPLKDPL